jgi:hypothetical protein
MTGVGVLALAVMCTQLTGCEIDEHLNTMEESIEKSFSRANARIRAPFPPSVLADIKAARTRKIAYHTYTLARERAGEHTSRSMARKRQRPPAHVWARMNNQERKADRVIRSASEVGYVGMIKEQVGMRTKSAGLWRIYEEGEAASRDGLDKIEAQIRQENQRRHDKWNRCGCPISG